MKRLIATPRVLATAGRWDIDFHLPAELVLAFPADLRRPVRAVADIVKSKRDPTRWPDRPFMYVDIASVDVVTGGITNPQELIGEEAPSRARKVIHAYDIVISTCRPTRGAIAVVPEELHGQICSTGFSVVRCKNGVNPFYLHFALRLASTAEQFRKWSTGSSYPAILDEDVEKTLVPVPDSGSQDRIAELLRTAAAKRDALVQAANEGWRATMENVVSALEGRVPEMAGVEFDGARPVSRLSDIRERASRLPPVQEENNGSDLESLLFDEDDNPPE